MLPNELKANKNNLEDGKILTCIEYPGYVQNSINKCLKTLGTIPKRDQPNEYLHLNFKQSNPFLHSLYGEATVTSNLLIKVKRTKKPSSNFTSTLEGVVTRTFRFNGMADYQIITNKNNKLNKVENEHLFQLFEQIKNPSTSEEELAFTFPEVARIDLPYDYAYQNNPSAHYKSVNSRVELSTRQSKKSTEPWGIKFDHPGMPTPPPFEKPDGSHILFSTALEQNLVPQAVKSCYEMLLPMFQYNSTEIPTIALTNKKMWLAPTLRCFLPQELRASLREVLPQIGYYFLDGPWRNMWVVYGYDPRTDPHARFFQGIDFRIRVEIPQGSLAKKKKSHTSGLFGPNKLPKKAENEDLDESQASKDLQLSKDKLKHKPTEVELDKKLREEKKLAEEEEEIKYYSLLRHFQAPPKTTKTILQICDIDDAKVQRLVKSGPLLKAPHFKSGWFKQSTLVAIRKRLNVKLKILTGETLTDSPEPSEEISVEQADPAAPDAFEADEIPDQPIPLKDSIEAAIEEIQQIGENGLLHTLLEFAGNLDDDEYEPFTIYEDDSEGSETESED